MYTSQQELLHTQMNAEPVDNSKSGEQLIEKVPLTGTPFWAIKHEEKWSVVMGRHKMNDVQLDTLDEVWGWLEVNSYTIVLRMMLIIKNEDSYGIELKKD